MPHSLRHSIVPLVRCYLLALLLCPARITPSRMLDRPMLLCDAAITRTQLRLVRSG